MLGNEFVVVPPSIKRKNWCVSLITSVRIINHQWVLQFIIFKSCEEPWQAQDKSTDFSSQSDKGGKNRDGGEMQEDYHQFISSTHTLFHCTTQIS